MDSQQRDQIRDLLLQGLSSDEIAIKLGVQKRQVAAVRAHATKGHYAGALDELAQLAKSDPARWAEPIRAEAGRALAEVFGEFDRVFEGARQLDAAHPELAESSSGPAMGLNPRLLGRSIQVRRAELGLKRRELAEQSQLSYPYLSEIENGDKEPSMTAFARLATALRLTPSELLSYGARVTSGPPVRSEEGEAARDDEADATQPTDGPGDQAVPLALESQSAPRAVSPPNDGTERDRWTQALVAATVRAELEAWARTELPGLVSEALARALRLQQEP